MKKLLVLAVFVVTWKVPVDKYCGDKDKSCIAMFSAVREKSFDKEDDAKSFEKSIYDSMDDARINGVKIEHQQGLTFYQSK